MPPPKFDPNTPAGEIALLATELRTPIGLLCVQLASMMHRAIPNPHGPGGGRCKVKAALYVALKSMSEDMERLNLGGQAPDMKAAMQEAERLLRAELEQEALRIEAEENERPTQPPASC